MFAYILNWSLKQFVHQNTEKSVTVLPAFIQKCTFKTWSEVQYTDKEIAGNTLN